MRVASTKIMALQGLQRPALLLLCASFLPALAQRTQYPGFVYPEDRSLCHSNDFGCIIGEDDKIEYFPIRTVDRPVITSASPSQTLPDPADWVPPPGLVFDFTGGLSPRPAEYVAPKHYSCAPSASAGRRR